MKTAFSLSESELKLCILAMGANRLPGTAITVLPGDNISGELTNSNKTALFQKGVMEKTRSGAKFSLGADTALITALYPGAYLEAKRTDECGETLCTIYLRAESITVLWKDPGAEYELIWVPAIKLAVGALANITQGLASEKGNTAVAPKAEWMIKGFVKNNDRPEITEEIYSCAEKQTMVFNGERFPATREDCVNKAAAWLLDIHGRELERVSEYE